MSVAANDSLLERVEGVVHSARVGDALVAVIDMTTYNAVAEEMGLIASEHTGEGLRLLIDRHTADHLRIACPGALTSGESVLYPAQANGAIDDFDRFFVILSGNFHVALIARVDPISGGIHGGWTGVRRFVLRIAEMLGGPEFASPADGIEEPGDILDQPQTAEWVSFRLMNRASRHYIERQRDMALDKDALASVLEILKSLSAKRRAHDILYVFVDQIAAVIGIDRCSVVRVWGNERQGHVLASHEDESITDIQIDLEKYPEILHSMETRRKVLVNDAPENELTRPFAHNFKAAGISSVLVIPIVLFDQNVGSFFLRAARKGGEFNDREVNFCEIVGEAASNALERAHLFDSIQKANQRLEHLAVTDGLTGLHNRRFFRERLEEEYERSVRYHVPLACILLDVDDFKHINDTYGHLQGDSILRELAARTLKSVRINDTVARYGGEELVVLLPQTDLVGVRQHAQRLLRNLSDLPYEGMPENERVTVSVGVALLDRDAMPNSDALIRAADEALYKAKTTGKNRVVIKGFNDT